MNRRLRKKLHKKYLDYVQDLAYVGDVTRGRYWRMRLMAADFFKPHLIDKNTLGSTAETGLDAFTTQAVRRYNLRFQVIKLPYHEEGLEDGSYVTFRFQSVEFPEISTDTYNNVEA